MEDAVLSQKGKPKFTENGMSYTFDIRNGCKINSAHFLSSRDGGRGGGVLKKAGICLNDQKNLISNRKK